MELRKVAHPEERTPAGPGRKGLPSGHRSSVTLNHTGFQVFGRTILAPSHLPQWLVFAEKCSANCETQCFYSKFDYIHIKDQPV